jgi:hypothetical protein
MGMAIETGEYETSPDDDDVDTFHDLDLGLDQGMVVAYQDRAMLISDYEPGDDVDRIDMSDITSQGGRFRLHFDDPDFDGLQYTDQVYDDFSLAELAYAVWVTCGGFHQPESSRAVPVEVATSGQDAVAAYLRLGNGYPKSRRWVAEKMDITEQTVSNYCQRVRNEIEINSRAIQVP